MITLVVVIVLSCATPIYYTTVIINLCIEEGKVNLQTFLRLIYIRTLVLPFEVYD